MADRSSSLGVKQDTWSSLGLHATAGEVIEINDDGQLLVDYHGNPGDPVIAKIAAGAEDCARIAAGLSKVLLVFENGDPGFPVVIGVLRDRIDSTASVDDEKTRALRSVEAETLVLRGDREIRLECGRGSILIRADGKIQILGVDVNSRASRTNKVRGATIKLN